MSKQYLDELKLETLGIELIELVLGVGRARYEGRHVGFCDVPEWQQGSTGLSFEAVFAGKAAAACTHYVR